MTGPRENILAVAKLFQRWMLSTSREGRTSFRFEEAPTSPKIESDLGRTQALALTYLSASLLRWSADAAGLLNDDELIDVQTRADNEVLDLKFQVPRPVVEEMPAYDSSWLLSEMQMTGSRAAFPHLIGS